MRLYDKQTTFTVIGGILLMYGLCLGLCGFFVYRFLIRTFDPAVYLLLAIVLCPLIQIGRASCRERVYVLV